MAEDVEGSLLHRIAELNEACLLPGIVDEEDDLRSPELDVLGLQAQEIFPHLVVDEVLRDVPPMLGGTEVVDHQKEKHEKADSGRCICFVNEKHGHGGEHTPCKGGLPGEELERRAEIGSGSDLEQEAGQIHDKECHLGERVSISLVAVKVCGRSSKKGLSVCSDAIAITR